MGSVYVHVWKYTSSPTRRGYERLNAAMELRSGDQLSMVLKNPNDYLGHLGTEFGKKTYKSIVEQTDLGLSKFYSILKFIVSGRLLCTNGYGVCVCVCTEY